MSLIVKKVSEAEYVMLFINIRKLIKKFMKNYEKK